MDTKEIDKIDYIDGRGMLKEDTDVISRYIQEKKAEVGKVEEDSFDYSTKRANDS